jgi:hypothetical protein
MIYFKSVSFFLWAVIYESLSLFIENDEWLNKRNASKLKECFCLREHSRDYLNDLGKRVGNELFLCALI